MVADGATNSQPSGYHILHTRVLLLSMKYKNDVLTVKMENHYNSNVMPTP